MLKQYSALAAIYDKLMSPIDYKSWADYIYSIYELADVPFGKKLELGAGSGKLSVHLSSKLKNLIITDLSKEMLGLNKKDGLHYIVCDMRKLPFKNNFSFIYSCFDSINYILKKSELKEFFNFVEKLLVDNGCFTFDVSLENNSLRYQSMLNRSGKLKDIKYEQKSEYIPSERIHRNEFNIYHNGELFHEVHEQKIYDFHEYFEILSQTGLYVENCFNSFTFEDAHSNSERVQFILKKKNNL